MDVEANTKRATLSYGFLKGCVCQVNLSLPGICSDEFDEKICKGGLVGENYQNMRIIRTCIIRRD